MAAAVGCYSSGAFYGLVNIIFISIFVLLFFSSCFIFFYFIFIVTFRPITHFIYSYSCDAGVCSSSRIATNTQIAYQSEKTKHQFLNLSLHVHFFFSFETQKLSSLIYMNSYGFGLQNNQNLSTSNNLLV